MMPLLWAAMTPPAPIPPRIIGDRLVEFHMGAADGTWSDLEIALKASSKLVNGREEPVYSWTFRDRDNRYTPPPEAGQTMSDENIWSDSSTAFSGAKGVRFTYWLFYERLASGWSHGQATLGHLTVRRGTTGAVDQPVGIGFCKISLYEAVQ